MIAGIAFVSIHLFHIIFCVQPGEHPDCSKVTGCPRLLHYSASLHLLDMLPQPPPLPVENTVDSHSLTSDEG